MTLQAFRIVKAKLVADAFSGTGARLYGGRWNSPGTAVVYAASSRSLSMLEMLVHLQSRELLLQYVVIPLEFDKSLVKHVGPAALPADWRASPVTPEVQQIGDRWIAAGRSAVLRVPSAIVEGEFNFLLNPVHPDFARIRVGAKQPLRFDPRLK